MLRRVMILLLALLAPLVPSDAGAQERTLVIDTWLEGASGGYHLQVFQEGGAEEIRVGLAHRDHGWVGIQATQWVPIGMGAIGWGAGNQWTGALGAVWICNQNPGRGVVVGYDQSIFYAFAETAGYRLLSYVGSDQHGPYVSRDNVVNWTGQWCAQLTLR